MKRILHTLASAGVKHNGKYLETVGDAGEHVEYVKSKVTEKLHIGPSGSPLATLHPGGIQVGECFFEMPKNTIKPPLKSEYQKSIEGYWPLFQNDDVGHTYIDYGLSWIFSTNAMAQDVFPGSITLNHMGVCINSDDPQATIKALLSALVDSDHSLYEDPAGRDEDMIWLFIGDKNSDDPMFEIVLPSPELDMNNHFQIDFDTNLSQEDLDKHFREKFAGEDIFDWELEIDGVGKVLQMGTIGNTDGIDFRLGIGNNKRSKKAHRDSMVEIS